jgi:8-oxo-dGTP diphosphatase
MDFEGYKNQGIHVDIALFTVLDGVVKTLLVRRTNEQFIGEWIIPGGCVTNDESVDEAARRELLEKTGIENIYMEQFHAFGAPGRDPRKRMVAIAYLALIDAIKIHLLTKTQKTDKAVWADITDLPELGFDHKDILKSAVDTLRRKLMNSNLAAEVMSKQFTLPELQGVYEIIMGTKLDRRNFRRKFLKMGLIRATGDTIIDGAHRPAKLYTFVSDTYQEVDIY